jgi:hypothetical protein
VSSTRSASPPSAGCSACPRRTFPPLELDLTVADSAWELTGCETCLEAIAADARRLAAASPSVEPMAKGLPLA